MTPTNPQGHQLLVGRNPLILECAGVLGSQFELNMAAEDEEHCKMASMLMLPGTLKKKNSGLIKAGVCQPLEQCLCCVYI